MSGREPAPPATPDQPAAHPPAPPDQPAARRPVARPAIPRAPEEVGILLSYACTARCRMCCFECGPGRKETMSLAEGLTFVRQAAEVPSVHTVVYSGGEPFLFPDLLLALTAEAARLGLRVKVVTNAFWAADAGATRRRLAPLVEAGLRVLEITADAFHQAHVPFDSVRTAVLVANEAGIEVHLAAVVTRSSPKLADVLDRLGPAVRIDKRAEFPCLPVGRAGVQVPREELLLKEGWPQGRCDLLRIPAIDPTGIAYACCGVAGFIPPLALGRPLETPLAVLLERATDEPLVLALSLDGPGRLARHLTESGEAKRVGTAFVHPCHLCHEVLADPETAAILRGLLEPRRLFLMIERDIEVSKSEEGQSQATASGGESPITRMARPHRSLPIPLPFRDDPAGGHST